MGKKEWNEAADAIAKAVVSVMPEMNEHIIRGRVFAFFASESEYSRAVYNDSNYYYVADVTKILEDAFESTAEDESAMVAASDFRWAYEQLPDNYKYRVMERYMHGIVRPGGSKERAELGNAVRKLTDILNTWNMSYEHTGPGARGVQSNARSRVEIDWSYSGDGSAKEGAFRLDGGAY